MITRSANSVSDACTPICSREYSLLHLVDEVELDALSWHLEHRGRLTIIFVELRICLVAVVIRDLDDAVVLKTTLKSSLGRLRVPGLADVNPAAQTHWLEQPSVNLTKVVISVQRTHPVTSLDAVGIATRRVSEWRVQAVGVPVLAAVVAGNDGTLSQRGLVTSKAEDAVALAVLEPEVVRLVIVSATARCQMLAKHKAKSQKVRENYRVFGLTASVNSPVLAVATPS